MSQCDICPLLLGKIKGDRMKAYILGIMVGIIILNVVYANIVMWESVNKNES